MAVGETRLTKWGPSRGTLIATVVCLVQFIGIIHCDSIDQLREVEQVYRWQEVDSPVQKGHSKGPSVNEPRTINVDRSDWFWRKPEHQHNAQVDEIVVPFEGFQYDPAKHLKQSYVIENKRFVEDLTSRCAANTVPANPMLGEPSFVIISPSGDIRVDATAPADLVKKAGFDPSKNTIIVVHGYTQSYPFSPYLRRWRVLFDITEHVGDQNLLLMDYSAISWNSYQETAASTSLVASFLANFIMKLIELGADRKTIHLVGNSIGGQVAALASKRITPKIGRITSIDTAGPCFGKWGIASNDPHHRLALGDAEEIVVFHYDDRFLGTPGQHGNIDIYVNNGSDQPGCKLNAGKMYEGIKSTLTKEDKYVESSHTRGQDLITAPLPDWCQQVAYECKSFESFSRGECGHCDDDNQQCYLMSMYFQYTKPIETNLNPPLSGRRLYIMTGGDSPYCSNHYQILIKYHEIPATIKSAKLELFSDEIEDEIIRVTASNQNAPRELSHLLLLNKPPVQFKKAKVQLQSVFLSRLDSIGQNTFTVEINFMSNINPETRRSFSSKLCPIIAQDGAQTSFDLVEC